MARLFFNEVEAVKIAQNMEKQGLAFYEAAAERAAGTSARDTFLQLAEEERKHLAQFQELEEDLQARRREGAGYADDEDIAAYIERLLQTQVFAEEGDAARLARDVKGDYEALSVGMRAERDSILFYQEMIDLVDSPLAREAFGRILTEERQHLRLLGDRSEHCEDYQG